MLAISTPASVSSENAAVAVALAGERRREARSGGTVIAAHVRGEPSRNRYERLRAAAAERRGGEEARARRTRDRVARDGRLELHGQRHGVLDVHLPTRAVALAGAVVDRPALAVAALDARQLAAVAG